MDQLYVASTLDGLMVFNTTSHTVTLGAPGVPVNPVALVSDDIGRAYVVERGSCQPNDVSGRVRVFGTDLVERTASHRHLSRRRRHHEAARQRVRRRRLSRCRALR